MLSSIAGAILHGRSESSLAAVLKQTEQYSWSVYKMRYNLLQGEGDSSASVSDRALTMPPVEPHESVRCRRFSGQRRPPSSSRNEEDDDDDNHQSESREDILSGAMSEEDASDSDAHQKRLVVKRVRK